MKSLGLDQVLVEAIHETILDARYAREPLLRALVLSTGLDQAMQFMSGSGAATSWMSTTFDLNHRDCFVLGTQPRDLIEAAQGQTMLTEPTQLIDVPALHAFADEHAEARRAHAFAARYLRHLLNSKASTQGEADYFRTAAKGSETLFRSFGGLFCSLSPTEYGAAPLIRAPLCYINWNKPDDAQDELARMSGHLISGKTVLLRDLVRLGPPWARGIIRTTVGQWARKALLRAQPKYDQLVSVLQVVGAVDARAAVANAKASKRAIWLALPGGSEKMRRRALAALMGLGEEPQKLMMSRIHTPLAPAEILGLSGHSPLDVVWLMPWERLEKLMEDEEFKTAIMARSSQFVGTYDLRRIKDLLSPHSQRAPHVPVVYEEPVVDYPVEHTLWGKWAGEMLAVRDQNMERRAALQALGETDVGAAALALLACSSLSKPMRRLVMNHPGAEIVAADPTCFTYVSPPAMK